MKYARVLVVVALVAVALAALVTITVGGALAAPGRPAAGAPGAKVARAGWPALPALPPAKAVTDDYAGISVVDQYRYFENLKDPVVQAFFRRENAYARAVLAKLEPGRGTVLARIAALDNAGPTVTNVQRVGDRYFYEKRAPHENTLKLYVRDVGHDDERVLVDPDKLVTKSGQHYTIEYFTPSFDGAYVGYGVSEGGSENATLHVVETARGTILPDTIDRAKYVGITGWRPDGTSFYYMRFPKLLPGESPNDSELRPVAFLHEIGRNPDADPAVFGIGVDPAVSFVPTDFPIVVTTPNSNYALGLVEHGVQNEQTIYAAPLAAVTNGDISWMKVADVGDDVTGTDVEGSTLYLLSHKNAPTFKIVATNLAAPDLAHAQTVVPAGAAIIEAFSGAKDGLYVRARNGGFGTVERVAYGPNFTPGTQTRTIVLPGHGAVGTLATDPRLPGATFDLVSWTTAQRYFNVDANGTVSDTGLRPPSTIDTANYTSQEAMATSADGTKVPISLVYRKDLLRDGTHPAYLEGYGSYGITIEPYFLGTRFAWLDQGGVWAVCHPRGGGWFGEDWHRAGMIATKQHTIADFIACGRYLVAQKYTSAQHLAGEGTSAGGITIGRSITEAPGLFAAALDVVGVSDAVRSEFSPNGPPNVPEFGSVKVAADVTPLLNMDAYLHVVDGTKYPAVMLNTGINDPRVSPWELAKFAARLQTASTSGRPILLRVDYDAGHGFLDTSRTQAEGLLADQFTFLLWQLGDPLFASLPQRIVVPRRAMAGIGRQPSQL